MNNLDYNRQLWDIYAKNWDKSQVWIENPAASPENRDSYLQYLGDEWGNKADVDAVVREFILPYAREGECVGEIGTGGGRIASRVAPRVGKFYCFDISSEMLKRAKEALSEYDHVRYIWIREGKIPGIYTEKFDFLYAFDVFVHFDTHMLWKYFQEIWRSLKPGGRAFIHTANLMAPDGWTRFSGQDVERVETHYFISPEIVELFCRKCGFTIIKDWEPREDNFYLNRDYLCVVEK